MPPKANTQKKARTTKKTPRAANVNKALSCMVNDMLSGRTMHYVDVAARHAIKEALLDTAPNHIRIMVIARIACLCGVQVELVPCKEANG